MPRTYVYQKPVPNESVYKHLRMLVNYLREQADYDPVEDRKEAFSMVADRLNKVAEGTACRKLQDYGE